jgi:membrane fusion protein (multidrug efflux system)
MIKRFAIALVLVVLVCGGLIGFNLFRSKMIADFFANQQAPAVTVSAMEVHPVSWTPEIETIGTLWAIQGVDVAVETAGRVQSIEFRANDRLEAGELLAQIDDAVERADLISAEAAVERDHAQLERAERLRETGVSSEQMLEEAQTAFAESESALARIQAVLDQKAIEAPFAGIIGIPRIEVGQYVQPGDVVATLQQLDTMRVDFTVPEQRLDEIRIGQPATFQLTTASSPYEGKITGIDPKVDPGTRLISVRAEVENPNGELRPGQFVRVQVALPEVPDVIALPQTAVVTSLYGDYVYVVAPKEQADAAGGSTAPNESGAAAAPAEGDTEQSAETPPPGVLAETEPQLVATQVFVEIGRRQGSLVEITNGLEAGQTVVTSGQNKLANNSPVVINNETDPAAVALEGGNGRS